MSKKYDALSEEVAALKAEVKRLRAKVEPPEHETWEMPQFPASYAGVIITQHGTIPLDLAEELLEGARRNRQRGELIEFLMTSTEELRTPPSVRR